MKFAGNLLIVAGIGILVFLIAGNNWNSHQTNQLITEFEQLSFQETNVNALNRMIRTEDNMMIQTDNKSYSGISAETAPVIVPAIGQLSVKLGEVIAVLEIDQIDLKVPVVQGAGTKQMSRAVGHLDSSGDLGQPNNNFAIAGHRSRTFGQFFNRLDELKLTDQFTIRTQSETYTYIVTNIMVVQPTDVDVILPVEGKSLITLITCHPFRSNKQRLIVQAEKLD